MAKIRGFGTPDSTKRTKQKIKKYDPLSSKHLGKGWVDSEQLNSEEISQNLDTIFKTRWHGAVNIRGIRYQILYSLLSAFELYKEKNSTGTLRLEGIEDVDRLDLVGFQYRSEYVQVKSANESWNWSRLKEPLEEIIRGAIGEALAREGEFQAYGQGLIYRVNWKKDETPNDFFDGKGTRIGHVIAGLDIVRPDWLEKIDAALNASKICILRASSGQGKSTLLYRYAYQKQSPENTFVLRVAETPEQVELIRNYLQFRASLGLPILLLIDDARWQTRLWASVAQQCAALGIRVLVTIRDEDWQRFAQESLTNYEILEPRLALEEARQIFKQLKQQAKLHKSATSPESAYEKIGEP